MVLLIFFKGIFVTSSTKPQYFDLHSPGPWEHSNGKIFGPTATAILTIHKHRSQTVTLANIALVKSAPLLLTALRELQANPNDPRAHRTALDAIAAATGSS